MKSLSQRRHLKLTRWTFLSMASALICTTGLHSQTESEESPEEVFELSPFEVATDEDSGYWASNTLSGTRLNTENRYVGASVTEITEQLLQDLAINDFEDVLDYVPNSAPEASGGLSADPNGNESIFGVRYRVRGFLLTTYSRDFFKTRVTPDPYNLERISFSRGPNSVLFGIAEPGGVNNAVSSRADVTGDRNHVGFRFDTWDSARYEASFNKVLIEDTLAVLLAGVYDDHRNHRNPWHNYKERYYGAVTYKPFQNTTIRLQHEKGEGERINARVWAPADGITVWQDAGAQSLPPELVNPDARTDIASRNALGVEEYRGNNPWISMTTGDVDQSTFYQTRWELRPAQNNVPGFNQRSNGGISFTDNEIIPMTANVLGTGNKLVQDFSNTSIFFEQKLAKDLYLEIAYNRQDTDNLPDFSTGSRDHVYVDLLPTVRSIVPTNPPAITGAPVNNANQGKYFTWNDTPVTFDQSYEDETLRAMLSYEFDFEDHWDGKWAQYLGHHRLGAMYEEYDTNYINLNYHFRNSVRPPDRTRYDLGSAWIALQNYLNIEKGQYNPVNIAAQYPRIWQENADEIPEDTDGDGIAPMWLGINGTNTDTEITSEMLVMQNFFWDKKIVTTFGWRSDDVDTASVSRSRDPVTGLRSDVRLANPSTGTVLKSGGDTMTRGVVVTPLPWIGFFYNESENFRPANADLVDIFGNPIGNESGEGKDYGIKLNLFKGKLTGSLTFFETSFINQSTRGPRVGPVGQFDAPRVAARTAIRDYYEAQGTPEKADIWNQRGYLNNDAYFATQNFDSEGWELSLNYTPTPNWRMTFNFSKQENVSSNVAPEMIRWTDFIRTVLTDPVLLNLETGDLAPNGTDFLTVSDQLDVSDQRAVEIKSLEGFADQRQPEKSANFVTAYTFSEGRLQGTTVGGSFRWRDRAAIGYQLQDDGSGALDATKPYYNNTTEWFGVFVGYRTKIYRDVLMHIQLNIDNVFDDEDLNPLLAREVNGQRIVNRWVLPEGRSFALSVRFDF